MATIVTDYDSLIRLGEKFEDGTTVDVLSRDLDPSAVVKDHYSADWPRPNSYCYFVVEVHSCPVLIDCHTDDGRNVSVSVCAQFHDVAAKAAELIGFLK